MKKKYGFCCLNGGIGDQIMFSSFPENFYKNTGEKIIDLTNSWVFDYNPYILRGEDPDFILSHLHRQMEIINKGERKDWKSDAEEICSNFGLEKTFLRSPRLYKYEESETQKDLVVVHTTGKTVGSMPEKIIKQIELNYSSYRVIQIGSSLDKQTNFEKMLDLNKWDTAKIISEASIYIGVNSGFYHVANCYPKVRKKIICEYQDENFLLKFEPKKQSLSTEWYDFNIEIFNSYEYDIGSTRSFKFI
jgi:hypothetical protein